MRKYARANIRKRLTKKKRGKVGRTTLLLMLLAFVVLFLPLFIVMLFSANRQEPEQKPLLFDEVDLEAPKILVWLSEQDQVVTVELEEYIACVVASEMPASFEMEALKAQSVAARSYSVARALNYKPIENPVGHQKAAMCDTTHCQVYRSEEGLAAIKSEEWVQTFWPKIKQAVNLTAGQVLWYDGALAGQTLFHSSSGGKTENSEDVFVSAVPYLKSVDSPYEEGATHNDERIEIAITAAAMMINSKFTETEVTQTQVAEIQITARSAGNRVLSVQIGELTLSGKEIRSLFDLSSTNFEVSVSGSALIFVSDGYGHGVGLSQYGAQGMAKEGYHYDEILTHYYSGVVIRTLKSRAIEE